MCVLGGGGAEPCGSLASQVIVYDFGNKSCQTVYSNKNYSCSTQLFKRECKSLADTLIIVIQNRANLPADAFSVNIGQFLLQLGLSGLVVIGGGLGIVVDNGPGRIPRPISLSILGSLVQTGQVDIKELGVNATQPPISRLTSVTLQSLQSIIYRNGDTRTPSKLLLTWTDFADMTSFRDLTCSPPEITLFGNRRLTSLEGLNRLATPTTSAVALTIKCGPCSPCSVQARTVLWTSSQTVCLRACTRARARVLCVCAGQLAPAYVHVCTCM